MTDPAVSPEQAKDVSRFPVSLWLGVAGSIAFFVAVSIKGQTPVLALFGLPYMMIFLDRRGDIGCAVAGLGLLASLVMSWYVLFLLGMGGGGTTTGEQVATAAIVGFVLCQCLLGHGAWSLARGANSGSTEGEESSGK